MARVFSSWEEGAPASKSRQSPDVITGPAPASSCSAPLPRLRQDGPAVSADSFTRFRPMLAAPTTSQASEGGPVLDAGRLSGVQHDAAPLGQPEVAGQCLRHVSGRDSRGRRSPATLCRASDAAEAMQADDPVWRLPPDSVSPPGGSGSLHMTGLRLGQFRFKGSATLAMVNVTPTPLAARR